MPPVTAKPGAASSVRLCKICVPTPSDYRHNSSSLTAVSLARRRVTVCHPHQQREQVTAAGGLVHA